ncbi:MAG: hypothetical protein N3D09_04925 [Archaeoglobaceae archaeon]|nr:hypothetical protein [Archaeoglobaceae archaeon]
MIEYAYFDEAIKGNSKEMVEYLSTLKKFFDAGIISEFAFTNGETSYFGTRDPIRIVVRVQGDIGEAKFQALKLLRELGYGGKETYNLDEIFKFVEKIDKMPLEEFLREIRRLRGQI